MTHRASRDVSSWSGTSVCLSQRMDSMSLDSLVTCVKGVPPAFSRSTEVLDRHDVLRHVVDNQIIKPNAEVKVLDATSLLEQFDGVLSPMSPKCLVEAQSTLPLLPRPLRSINELPSINRHTPEVENDFGKALQREGLDQIGRASC